MDDKHANREITRKILEGSNYRVITASDGAEAVTRCIEYRGICQSLRRVSPVLIVLIRQYRLILWEYYFYF